MIFTKREFVVIFRLEYPSLQGPILKSNNKHIIVHQNRGHFFNEGGKNVQKRSICTTYQFVQYN